MSTVMHIFSLIFFSSFLVLSQHYRPLVLIHGLSGNYTVFDTLVSRVKKDFPGIQTFTLDAFNNEFSLITLQRQIPTFSHLVFNISQQFGDVTLLGYSQGGLVARGVAEESDNWNIHTVLSMSAPLAGEFGPPGQQSIFFPVKNDNLWKLCYTLEYQNISGCNQWKDPYHIPEYLQHSELLPYLDNEITHSSSQRYKSNYEHIERLVLIGGPDDGVIVPWQSAQFGFYDSNLDVVPMNGQKFFQENWFGLKTLNDEGRIKYCTLANVHHGLWPINENVYEMCIKPYLV